MPKKLSKRLSACLDALSSLSRCADIGTDHAYLPCYAVATGIIDSAIAIDVIDGPLARAKQTIADYGLAGKVELRKGSGLKPLEIGEVEGVVFAGMGGKLISQLLLDSLSVAKSLQLLVFAPQGGESILRATLFENDFAIKDETLLEEDGIIYPIITAKPCTKRREKYSDIDIIFGPVLRQDVDNELFISKWAEEITKIELVLENIPEGNERRVEFMKKKKIIEGVLAGATS